MEDQTSERFGDDSKICSPDPALKKVRSEQTVSLTAVEQSILPMGNSSEKETPEAIAYAFLTGNAGTHIEDQGYSEDDQSLHKEIVNEDASISSLMKATSKPARSIPTNSIHGNGLPSIKAPKEVCVGPRRFTSSVDMLRYFNQLLTGWPLDHDVNKYEHMMLVDLLRQGHPDFCEKTGTGIEAFQVRINREFNSRCFYVIRKDGSMKDFSYRKCINNVLSLPKNLKSKFGRKRSRKSCESQHNGNACVTHP